MLLMTGTVYTDEHLKNHLFLQFLFEKNKEAIIKRYSINAYSVLRSGTGVWFYDFLPAFLVSGYMYNLSSERKNGGLRFMMVRESISTYCLSKLLSLMISGAVITFSAGAIYAGVVFGMFPGKKVMDEYMIQTYPVIYGNGSLESIIIVWLFEMFILGALAVVPGYLAGIFFNDRYMLICVPILINYVYSQVLQKIEMIFAEKEKYDIYDKTGPYKLSNLFYRFGSVRWRKTIILYLSFTIILYICFCMVVKRHRKRGIYA